MAKGKKQRKGAQDSDSEWVQLSDLFLSNTGVGKFRQNEAAVEHVTRGLHTKISLIVRFFFCESYNHCVQKLWAQDLTEHVKKLCRPMPFLKIIF